MTKQQIMAAIVECEDQLGRAPSFIELAKMKGVSRKQVRWHFGNYRKALKACGAQGCHGGGGSQIELETLFKDWALVVRELKKIPTTSEYVKAGKYSQTPLMTRFGVWANVPAGMKVFAQQKGWTKEWKDVLEIIERHQRKRRDRRGWTVSNPTLSTKNVERMGHPRTEATHTAEVTEHPEGPDDTVKHSSGREVFGKLMRPGPMVCAPTNEQGVLFLFGARAEELGFAVLKIRTEYPDCLAFRQVGEDRIELVRIEFEFESKNFLRHMHEVGKCDAIVCWRHNWEGCPLEVIELGGSGDRVITRDRKGKTLTTD
jgi:hypothetical protein